MRRVYIIVTIIIYLLSQSLYAQKERSDANVFGHVICCGEHLPYVSISLKGTTIGTLTDETGHYQLINLPAGSYRLAASSIGYKTLEIPFSIEKNQSLEINFELEVDLLNLSEVVISGDRSEQKRVEAPVIVNTIPVRLFSATQSMTLGEGLNFLPGLRLESNCQNCGFTQVRINGMEGPYSQILINNRPIFSGLAGVYGLELIPANMIEKVEVVRGGGSALYGSNAIAGTINIILKEPLTNQYEAGLNYSLTGYGLNDYGSASPDYIINFNTSMVSDDSKAGIAMYGSNRERSFFDINDDGFSEIAPLNNLTMGTRFFHRTGSRGKLTFDFFTIKEQRDGGNKQDMPLHERDVAEAVKHDMKTGAISFEQYLRDYDQLSVYFSGQLLNRDSYYGANQSLRDYGNSKDKTYNTGIQYKAVLGNTTLIAGIENTGGFLSDKKLAYPDYDNALIINDSIADVPHTDNTMIAEQSSIVSGFFAQYEIKFNQIKIIAGGRYDHYRVVDFTRTDSEIIKGNVISPRLSIMYDIIEEIKARINYSQGFRAPQIFDEDLHIETSGSRQIINKNDPGLKQETSHSISASLDFNGLTGPFYSGFLVEGFFTRLMNPFVNEIGVPDEEGVVIYTRKNSQKGATVKGINLEYKLKTTKYFSLSSGFTIQSSKYDIAQEFNERHFFRTPDTYGYFTADWDMTKNLCLSINGNYTGSMLVPYFGPETDPVNGELRKSDDFFDLGLKMRGTIKINSSSIQIYGGVKNIFNAYQNDLGIGADRDPTYIYGPVLPRTLFFGLIIGNSVSSPATTTNVAVPRFPVPVRPIRHRQRGNRFN